MVWDIDTKFLPVVEKIQSTRVLSQKPNGVGKLLGVLFVGQGTFMSLHKTPIVPERECLTM